jgi:PmbA protein
MPDLSDLCVRAVAEAQGDEEIEAYAEGSRHVQVRVRGGEVESLTSAETRGLGVRALVGGRVGYAYGADPTPEEVAALVRSARESAAFSEADDANRLPDLTPPDPLPGMFREALERVPAERKVSLALEVERAATAVHPDVAKVESATFADSVSRAAIASTRGGPMEFARTDCWVSVSALAERGGETQSGFDFALARELDELEWEAAARSAAERAARLLGGEKPRSERLPVVLDPAAGTAFLSVLAGALSGEAVLKGRSPLATLVGHSVASEAVTLVDDGRLTQGSAASPFDDEGVHTSRTPLVEAGVLRGFLHNTYTAARLGTTSTGNAGRQGYRSVPGVSPSNLAFEPGGVSAEEVVRAAGRGVYVQDVTGLHSGASSVTGDFSVGAAGLAIEDGALGRPLREMTVASTLLDVLRGVTALGSDLRFFPFGGSLGSPTILVGEMTVAGT